MRKVKEKYAESVNCQQRVELGDDKRVQVVAGRRRLERKQLAAGHGRTTGNGARLQDQGNVRRVAMDKSSCVGKLCFADRNVDNNFDLQGLESGNLEKRCVSRPRGWLSGELGQFEIHRYPGNVLRDI